MRFEYPPDSILLLLSSTIPFSNYEGIYMDSSRVVVMIRNLLPTLVVSYQGQQFKYRSRAWENNGKTP